MCHIWRSIYFKAEAYSRSREKENSYSRQCMLTIHACLGFPVVALKCEGIQQPCSEKKSRARPESGTVLLFNKSQDKRNLFILPTFAKLSGCVITDSHRN